MVIKQREGRVVAGRQLVLSVGQGACLAYPGLTLPSSASLPVPPLHPRPVLPGTSGCTQLSRGYKLPLPRAEGFRLQTWPQQGLPARW